MSKDDMEKPVGPSEVNREELESAYRRLRLEARVHRSTVRALKESEARFRSIAENIPDIVARFDRELRHLYINPAVESVTGLSQKDYVGKTNRELGMPEKLCVFLDAVLNEVFRTGEVKSSSFEFDSRQGPMHFQMLVAPEFDEVGGVRSIISVARDITKEKLGEQELRRSRLAFRDLAENAHCGIARVDLDYRFVYANPSSKELFRADHQKIVGSLVNETALTERAARVLSRTLDAVTTGAKTRKLKLKDDSSEHPDIFEIVLVPEFSERGEVESVLMISHNITESERAKEFLRQSRAQSRRELILKHHQLTEAESKLSEAERLSDIGTLAATVAHELRNPLGVIQTAVYNIQRKRQNPDIDKHVASIEKKIEESNRIISNLLNYSRLKEPRLKLTNLASLIDESLSGAAVQHLKCDMTVETSIDSIREVELKLDPDQIREVLTNLINNSYQAMEEGRGVLEIGARMDGGESISVYIQDNGRGMDEDTLAHALDPFFTTKSKGTGLGLTICRDIMKLHGGELHIDSEEGQGTTATVTLPVR